MRDTFILKVGCRKSIILLDGSQASPACPSGRNSLKIKICEIDLRMLIVKR